MFSRIKSISFVGTLILALISPATPASIAAVTNLQTEVIFNGSAINGTVEILDGSLSLVEEQTGVSPTFASLANGDYVVVASQNQDSPTDYLMSYSVFDLSVDDTGVTAFHARGDSSSPVAESAAGVYQLEIAISNYYLPVLMPDGSALPTPDAAVQDQYGFNGELQVANGSNWDFVMPWMSYFEMDVTGIVSGGVAGMIGDPGTYRVVVDPAGFSDIRVYSAEFTVAPDHDFSSQVALSPLNLKSANFQVSPMSVDGSSALDSSAVRVFKADGPTSAPLKGEFVTDSGTSDGSTLSFSLVDGSYVIDVVPQGGGFGLAEKTYYLEMSSSVPTVTDKARTSYSANSGSGVFELPVASANILGTLQDSGGSPIVPDYLNSKWINVNLLQSYDNGNYFGWVSSTDVDENGQFAFGVAAAGAYKLEIEFNGFPDFGGISQLVTFTDANIDTPQTFTLTPAAPDLKIAVRVPDGNSNLTNADIEIFNGYEYVGRGSTSESGIAALTLPDVDSQTVEYELRVNPPRSAFGTAKISYTAEVVDDGSTRTVSVKTRTSSPTTVAPVDGITTLTLGVPTLSGVVTDPNGSLVRNVEVVPIDTATGQEIWESMAVTDAFGRWSMALAQGSYDVFARAPWGDVTFGDGERVGPVAVDASGNATSVPAGVTAGSFDLSLSNPTWSGTLVDPNDSSNVLTMGNICLATGSYEMRNWNCAQTNSEGKWSLSKPSGFTGFLEIDELMISEWGTGAFAERRLEGVTAIENVLGTYVAGTSYENIQLSPKAPNLQITVNTDSGAASRAWVSVENSTSWLGGGETNASGVANIGIPDANLTDELIVQVYIDHVDSLNQDYANTKVVLTNPGAVGTRTEAVSLAKPNFSVTLSEPSGDGSAISYGWIEIMNQATGEWVGGANTNQSGAAAMNLPADATYDVTVNPSWNGDSSFTKKTYVVAVNADGALTSVTDSNAVPVDGAGSPVVYPLVLGTPSLTGLVRDSSGNAQADSWVTPINHTTKEYLWYLGANTRSGGQFSMDLANGQYYLEAQPSWRNSGDTTSAQCSVEIASGSLNQSWSAADRCAIDVNGNALLDLRAPNLSFTLKDASGAVVPYANVGMFLNEWSVWAQSNRYGVVSLFVSGDDINAQTDLGSGTHDIRIVVEPPYGNGDIARIECDSGESQPLCAQIPDYDQDAPSDLDTAIGALALSEVSFAAPNTKLRVADPAGSPLLAEGSWVNIFEEVLVGGTLETQWVAGANSDSNGWVSFNLDEDISKTYMVEVNPAYEKRDDYAQTTYAGLTQAGLVSQQLFNLGTPNFKLKVMKADNSGVSRWGWVGVEEVDANGDYIDWVTGVGTDRNGYVALSLEANKRYRIILNPGEVSDGSITRCLFEVSDLGVVSSVSGSCDSLVSFATDVWTIKLSAGNVTGTIFYDNGSTISALGGAIIQATNGTETVTTVAGTDGSYGLDLELSDDNGAINWTITAVYAKDPEDSNAYVQDSAQAVNGGVPTTANLTFTHAG